MGLYVLHLYVADNLIYVVSGNVLQPSKITSRFTFREHHANPLDRVTENELLHYINVLKALQLLSITNFTQDKEWQVRALLLEFLATIKLVPSSEWGLSVNQCFMSCLGCLILFDSRTQFPFPLVVHVRGEKLCYTPRSDFHMRIRDFPHLLLQVNSQPNESDRYRMFLQASCLARLGNSLRASTSGGPIVIMAIYINKDFKASQYLLHYVATSTEVSCVTS
jgi:hypothetical protein